MSIESKRISFIARLERELALEASRAKQAEIAERERRAQRKRQAEEFREESGVGEVLEGLIKLLETAGKGRRGLSGGSVTFLLNDPDSVYDIASWDRVECDSTHERDKYSSWHKHLSEKCTAIETYPDGTIVVHGGWRGSTTIPLAKWRGNDRAHIFDNALKKAYENPATNKFTEKF